MQAEKIEDIHEKFEEEWLLIEVTKSDKLGQPLAGRLLEHSPDHEDIWRLFRQHYKEGRTLLVEFAGEPIPRDWEAVL